MTMLRFARTCDAVAATSRKLEKTALVADYLRALPSNEAAIAAIFLSGRPFATHNEPTLQVGGALLWRVIGELSGRSDHELTEIYRKHGDAGSVAAAALPERTAAVLSLVDVQRAFFEIAAARGPAAKASLLRRLLERSTPLEAKYVVKIIGGDLRIGLKESLVEEAIARAFEAPLEQVKRANMLLGDLGEAQSRLAFEDPDERSLAAVLRAPVATAISAEDLETLFTAARDRGNEGLMIKDLDSLYTPGRRGKSWLKMKRELATLDVLVTAVEYGHGKRIGVLSDYTFAVWDGERLVNIGKAYSGLTDAEIAEMTGWFLEHTMEDQGFRRVVEPKIVLEVAFNNMMQSDRHESGYALRFPRIVRLRPDKAPQDADTIERARQIFEQQSA